MEKSGAEVVGSSALVTGSYDVDEDGSRSCVDDGCRSAADRWFGGIR